MTIKLAISPAYIPYSNVKIGSLTLMEHQKEIRESDEKLLVLNAPTSSGKTLAMLARFLETSGNAMFLYPTNELIRDQSNGIRQLLEQLGTKSTVIPLEKEIQPVDPGSEVVIAVVTGDSLEGVAETKGEAIRQILHTVRQGHRLLLLTNIDTLLLLFKMRFSAGRTLLSEFLQHEYSLLAIDELHLYSGIAFANLLYLTWLLRRRFRQIILSSATLQESSHAFRELFPDHRDIKPTVNSESDGHSRQIRHRIDLEIKPAARILSSEDLNRMVNDLQTLLSPNPILKVDTLTIVNSVVLSEQLSDQLTELYNSEMVGTINGLVPSDLREQRTITIGTSAVEVGVDFDVQNLLIEATNLQSFIQRLGRGGRHRAGNAIAYIPVSAYRKLEGELSDSSRQIQGIDIDQLHRKASRAIPHLENYGNFSKSIYGAVLFTSILYTVEKEAITHYDPHEIRQGIEKGWKELRPPFWSQETLHRVETIADRAKMEIVSQGGARGDITTVPVFLEKYSTYSRMDILELVRTKFRFQETDSIEAPRPPWMTESRVPIVEGFENKIWIQGTWRGPLLNRHTEKILYTTTQGDNTNLSLNLEDQSLEELAQPLFHNKTAHPTTTRELTDWRFPRIYNARHRSQCLIIGLDALVQKHVESKHE